MRRREFIAFVGYTAAAWPLPARAEQSAVPVIGFLSSASPQPFENYVARFRAGLKETGYVDSQNVAIAFRWAEGHYDRLPALAAELVHRNVAVIFASGGPPSALAAKAATVTTPTVFIVADPIKLGLVASLNHPGGNATGVGLFNVAVEAKKLEILHELAPNAMKIGVLVNPHNPKTDYRNRVAVSGRCAGIAATHCERGDRRRIQRGLHNARQAAGRCATCCRRPIL